MSAGVTSRRAIGLVVRREIVTRARTKAFLVSNAVTLVILVAAIVAASVFGGDDDPLRVGLVGGTAELADGLSRNGEALGEPVETRTLADEAQARRQVEAGDLEVALLPADAGGVVAVTADEVDPALQTVLDATVQQRALDAALDDQGVDPAELTAATEGAVVVVQALDPPDPDAGERAALAYVAVLLLFFQVFLFGIYVAMGVVEEKSSRVVELLLATIRPLDLLVGKIVGIGLVGLAQLAATAVVGVGAATATGLLTISGTAWVVVATTLAWYVLGFAFFAVLYAAAGSLVSRQEDVNSASTPVNLLAFAVLFLAQFTLADPDGRVASVMSWVPPFSSALMPLRVAAGVTSPLQVVGAAALMLVASALLAVLAAKVYERSVLRTGATVSWKEALGSGRRRDPDRREDARTGSAA